MICESKQNVQIKCQPVLVICQINDATMEMVGNHISFAVLRDGVVLREGDLKRVFSGREDKEGKAMTVTHFKSGTSYVEIMSIWRQRVLSIARDTQGSEYQGTGREDNREGANLIRGAKSYSTDPSTRRSTTSGYSSGNPDRRGPDVGTGVWKSCSMRRLGERTYDSHNVPEPINVMRGSGRRSVDTGIRQFSASAFYHPVPRPSTLQASNSNRVTSSCPPLNRRQQIKASYKPSPFVSSTQANRVQKSFKNLMALRNGKAGKAHRKWSDFLTRDVRAGIPEFNFYANPRKNKLVQYILGLKKWSFQRVARALCFVHYERPYYIHCSIATGSRRKQVPKGVLRFRYGKEALKTLFKEILKDDFKPETFSHLVVHTFNRFCSSRRTQKEVNKNLKPEELQIIERIKGILADRWGHKEFLTYPYMTPAQIRRENKMKAFGK